MSRTKITPVVKAYLAGEVAKYPELGLRPIAKLLGVSAQTIASIRKEFNLQKTKKQNYGSKS